MQRFIEFHCGTTRMVVLCGPLAIKFPYLGSWRLFLHGLLANLHENDWRNFSDKLCRIRFSCWGGFCNVMDRAIPLTFEQWQNVSILDFDGATDFKRENFGMLNGRIVAFDYGQ